MSKKLLPHSTNLIFFDSEFTTLNSDRGELMSVALIRYDGEELYLELEYNEGTVEPWVKKHVVPFLRGKPISKEAAKEKIWSFIGKAKTENEKPYLVAYVNQFDAIYWYKLFGSPTNHPCFWIPIDFASMLFAYGYRPNSFGRHKFFKELGIDKSAYQDHYALDDARLLRDVYLKMVEHLENQE